jgi:hypothetical protein
VDDDDDNLIQVGGIFFCVLLLLLQFNSSILGSFSTRPGQVTYIIQTIIIMLTMMELEQLSTLFCMLGTGKWQAAKTRQHHTVFWLSDLDYS